jgi:cation transport ATPase
MQKVFYVKGLSCKKCKARIFNSLITLPEINTVKIKVDSGKVIIDSKSEISDQILAEKVSQAGESYSFTNEKPEFKKVLKKKIKKYYPLVSILTGVALVSFVFTIWMGYFEVHTFMRFFMAFFFLVFGGLKFVNPDKFRETFALYDPLASRSVPYKMLYPFLEIGLGFIYLLQPFPLLIPNLVTICILSATTFGIYKALKEDKELQCACLGGFFSIPISWVTVFENLLMVAMAVYMLLL